MSTISPVVNQRPMEYMGTMVKEGAKLEATIYGGIGLAAGALVGLASRSPVGALAGAAIGGATGAAIGGVGGAIDGMLATAGTAILDPQSNEEFKNSAAIGAVVGGAGIGLVSGLASGRPAAALPGLVVGGVVSYFVGRAIADRTLDAGG